MYAGERPSKALWVHAVSVGEARAAAPLVRELQRHAPDHTLVMTCTTAAGRQTLNQVYGDSVRAIFLPYDYPETVEAFLERFRPRLGVLVETELWPNLLAACERRGVPVVLANARMSEKSARGYQRWRSLAGAGDSQPGRGVCAKRRRCGAATRARRAARRSHGKPQVRRRAR